MAEILGPMMLVVAILLWCNTPGQEFAIGLLRAGLGFGLYRVSGAAFDPFYEVSVRLAANVRSGVSIPHGNDLWIGMLMPFVGGIAAYGLWYFFIRHVRHTANSPYIALAMRSA